MHEAYMVLAPTNISVMIESMTSYGKTKKCYRFESFGRVNHLQVHNYKL